MDDEQIRSRHDYYRALNEIAGLMTAKWNSPEGERLDALVTMVEAWEREHVMFEADEAA